MGKLLRVHDPRCAMRPAPSPPGRRTRGPRCCRGSPRPIASTTRFARSRSMRSAPTNYGQERARLALRRLELRRRDEPVGASTRFADRIAALEAPYGASVEASLASPATRRIRCSSRSRGGTGSSRIPLDGSCALIGRTRCRDAREGAASMVAKLWEFVTAEPRESNTEGGVFPAIFGTVMMVLIMSVLATPLGVLAACTCASTPDQGPFVSAVRIAVNNLAGVPSIVFGVFGVGFFIYTIGGTHRSLVLRRGVAHADVRDGRHPVGIADAGAPDRARGDRRHRRRAGRRSPRRARGFAGARRDEVRDHLARRASGRVAVDPHRPDPGDGARRRRGGPADDHRRRQARARVARSTASFRSSTSSASSCTSASTSTTSASSRRTSMPRGRWST